MKIEKTCVFPGYFSNMEDIYSFTSQAAELADFDSNTTYDVQIAVGEACVNIIKHGYGGEGRGDIEYTYCVDPDKLTVTLRDTAPFFNPNNLPTRNPEDNSKKLIKGGWGIYLIRQLMDEVQYKYTPDSLNVLEMVKRKK